MTHTNSQNYETRQQNNTAITINQPQQASKLNPKSLIENVSQRTRARKKKQYIRNERRNRGLTGEEVRFA